MNVIGKNVINIPRKVHYSRELIKKMNEEFSKELCDLIKLFEKKFEFIVPYFIFLEKF